MWGSDVSCVQTFDGIMRAGEVVTDHEEGNVAVAQLGKAPDEVGDGLRRICFKAPPHGLLSAALQHNLPGASKGGHGPDSVAHLLLLPLLEVALHRILDLQHSDASHIPSDDAPRPGPQEEQ